MRLLLLFALALPARAAAAAAPTLSDPEDGVRLEAVTALRAQRSEPNYKALASAMSIDLSDKVRQGAALALLEYDGTAPLLKLEEFLRAEEGAQVREAVCLALATTTVHPDNPEATALLAERLAEDAAPEVRLAAVQALETRRDRRALKDLRQAADKDADPKVRARAKKAHKRLSIPPKAPPPPAKSAKAAPADTRKGRDRCGDGNGWCECANEAMKLRPRCVPREDCQQSLDNTYRRHGYGCQWDGQALN